jgi:hypothetical protein
MTVQVVALIDDNPDDMKQWRDQLARANITAIAFSEKDTFKQSIERGDHFDAVVLDWIFADDSSSIMARLVLEQCIRPHLFVPVLVYTQQKQQAQDEIRELKRPFDRIEVISKDDVGATELPQAFSSWYATTGAKLSEVWRDARRLAFEHALYELDALEGENLQATLQHLIVGGEEKQLDIDHALEFLERLVGRKVPQDQRLRTVLRTTLGEGQLDPEAARKINRSEQLINAHRYLPLSPASNVVRTGDVVDVLDSQTQLRLMLAVIITPDCDLENRKCRELRLLIAQVEPPQEMATQWWELPAILRQGQYENYWLDFHHILCLADKAMERDPRKNHLWKSVLTYEPVYEDTFGKQLHLKLICRLDDPYRADLLQKFSSHAARIGIPS